MHIFNSEKYCPIVLQKSVTSFSTYCIKQSLLIHTIAKAAALDSFVSARLAE